MIKIKYGGNLACVIKKNIFRCPPPKYRCLYGGCVGKSARCDGYQDCVDGSDEFQCDLADVCTDLEYRCRQSLECVSLDKICDGKYLHATITYISWTCKTEKFNIKGSHTVWTEATKGKHFAKNILVVRMIMKLYADCHLPKDFVSFHQYNQRLATLFPIVLSVALVT